MIGETKATALAPTSAIPNRRDVRRSDGRVDKSFGELVRDDTISSERHAHARGGSATGVAPAPRTFAAHTAIGDFAARFDSRAIVAPTFEPIASAKTDSAPAMHSRQEVSEAGRATEFHAPDMIVAAVATHTGPASLPIAAEPASLVNIAGRHDDPSGAAVVAPVQTDQSGDSHNVDEEPVSTPSKARTAKPATGVRLAARVAMAADEMVIAISGVTLTADEEWVLVRTAHDSLTDTLLGNRPVRIVSRVRK